MLALYYTRTACSIGCHIALEESGAEFEPRAIRLHKPEEKEKYRSINPRGSVPALQIDDVILLESVAILTYVAQRFPSSHLWPEDPLDQARCLSMMSWFSSSVHISRRQYRAPHYFTSDTQVHGVLRDSARVLWLNNLKRIDELFTGRQWLINDRFSAADCYAMVFYQWGVLDELDMSSLVAYSAFKDRMLARPATRRVLERERSVLIAPKEADSG